MTSYFEYGVNLSDNQKKSLASAMHSKSPLTLRIKHGNLTGNDELMLTKTQLKRIQKSLNNGTGADIKISKTQIRWKSFLNPCKSWSKSVAICCKRFVESCTSISDWCCICSWKFGY